MMIKDSFLIWHSASITDPGNVRKINEDANLDLPELGLWVVADGMGGHEAGDVASRMIVEKLQQINEPANLNSFVSEAQNKLLEVNQKLRGIAVQQFNNGTIGSTVVVLLAYGKQCAFLWVGDSRIYRLRNNQLEQMTRDHSMVEEYIEEGRMSRQEAENSNISNVLTRAVGVEDELIVDIKIEDIQADDTFLLCTDGLYREVLNEDILKIINCSDNCPEMTKNLLTHALDNGAKDNVTITVVQIKAAY